ncbi:unnamed protein product, partial [Mesorhabditis belari]|uniref:RING-type domain-containing protein n=1 Tax=Mesorhabditis belari TaxID=2138241 RepID=A0AAF3J1Q3_9BILA
MEDGSGGDGSSESEAMGGVECALCSQPPIDPLSVLVCGHHFCKECFQREPSSSTRCPECGVEIDDDDVRIMDEAMQQIIFQLYPQTFFVTLEKRRKFLRDESQENIYPSWLLDNLETTYDPEEKVIVEVKWVSWPDWEQLTNVGKKRKIEEHSIDNERPSSSNSPCHVQLSESTISILPTTFRRYFRLPAKSTVSSLAKILEQKLEAPTKNSFVHFFSPCFQKIVEPNTKFGDIMLQQKGGRFRRVKLAFVCVQDSLKDELEPELGVEAMPILEVESSGEEAVPPVPALDHRPLTPTDPLSITFPSKRQFANADGFPKKLLQAAMPRKRRKPSSPTKRIPETGTPPPIIQTNPSSSTNLGSTTSLEALSEMPSPLGPPKILNSSMGTQVAGPSILHPPITGPIPRPPKPKTLLGHGDGMPTGIHGLRPGVLPMGAPMLNGQKMAAAGEHRLPTTQKVSITSTPLATAQQQMQNYNLKLCRI